MLLHTCGLIVFLLLIIHKSIRRSLYTLLKFHPTNYRIYRYMCWNVCVYFSCQLLSCVQRFATPWTAALQAPLCSTICQSLFKFMSIEPVMLSNHLIHLPLPFSFTFNLSQHLGLSQIDAYICTLLFSVDFKRSFKN